jgi:hypothetical protein
MGTGQIWQGAYTVVYADVISSSCHSSEERSMGSKRTSRRELLKSGGALAGGVTLGAVAPALGQTPASDQAPAHDHSAATGSHDYPMIMGKKELIAYGERSHFVTSVRIAHPMGGRPSPDEFGKVFHVASPLQDSVGVITPRRSTMWRRPAAPIFRTSIPSSTC